MTGYSVVRMTPEHYPAAIEVLRHSFFRDEKLCQSVGLLCDSPEVLVDPNPKYVCTAGSLELEALLLDIASDGMSVVAVDASDLTQVLGVAFNKLQTPTAPGELNYYEKFLQDEINDPSAKALVELMLNINSKLNLFDYFKADCGIEITSFSVKSTHRGQGIATALIKKTIEMAKMYEGIPKIQFVGAAFSYRLSQKGGLRCGLKTILEIPYDRYKYNGRANTGIFETKHKVCTLSGVKI